MDLIAEWEGCMVEECIVIVIICIEEDMEGFMDHPGRMAMECNSSFGGPMGGYGLGGGGPYGDQDPNNPYGAPSPPPGFWISFLRVVSNAMLEHFSQEHAFFFLVFIVKHLLYIC